MFLRHKKQNEDITNSHICRFCSHKFPLKFERCPQCDLSVSERIESYKMDKTLIELAVEKALLKIGIPELELVKSKLNDDYNCTIQDCLNHPEYLKTILCHVFGNCHRDIVDSIYSELKKTSMEKPITDFLNVITVHA